MPHTSFWICKLSGLFIYLGISKHKAPISLRQLTDVNEKLVCLKNFRFVAEIDLRHLGPFGIFDLLKYDKNVSRKLVVERTIYISLCFLHVSNRDYAGMDVYSEDIMRMHFIQEDNTGGNETEEQE